MAFGWQIVVGSVIGFMGAAFGSVGGVGGGGIYVPMLSLIIGFDPKSSTAISKCMRNDLCNIKSARICSGFVLNMSNLYSFFLFFCFLKV